MESHVKNQGRLMHLDGAMDVIPRRDFQVVLLVLMHRNMQVGQGDQSDFGIAQMNYLKPGSCTRSTALNLLDFGEGRD